MEKLAALFISVKSSFSQYILKVREYAEGKSKKFDDWKSDTRATVYGSGAACVAAGPFAIFACPAYYATAAGILETKIDDRKHEVNNIVNGLNNFANGFANF